jgi:hypothetical protein
MLEGWGGSFLRRSREVVLRRVNVWRTIRRGFLAFAVLALVAPPNVEAQAKPRGQEKKAQGASQAAVSVVFSTAERETITRFFGANPVGNVKPLPPGIAKNLARGKPLPPGIAKRYVPDGLMGQLPVRAGYEYRQVGLDVVLVEAATGVVMDILRDVVR